MQQRYGGMAEGLSWLDTLTPRLKYAWGWCKTNWKFLLGLAIPIIAAVVFRKGPAIGKMFQIAKDSHNDELEVLKRAHAEEIAAREAALKNYKKMLLEVELQAAEKNQHLDNKKRKEVARLLKDNTANPEEITRRLAEITGFELEL
jgi:Skp family chaperone for outer membrane proteins